LFNTLIRISYDGSNYSGFQTQANASTVQEALERALKVIYKQPVRVAGAGRTDSGVHARGQTASFQAPFHIAADNLPHALNALLPADIVVTAAEYMPENFHARFDALAAVEACLAAAKPEPKPEPEPVNPLAGFSDADLLAEIARRGLVL
jgi:tRNA pseudouridine38-40 synthase